MGFTGLFILLGALIGRQDLWIVPLTVIGLILFAYTQKERMTENLPNSMKLFFGVFAFRIIACIFSICLFQFYFQRGDIFAYHKAIITFREVFWANPIDGLTILTTPPRSWSADVIVYFDKGLVYFQSLPTGIVVRFGGILILLLGGSFLASSLVFATLAFFGGWILFRYFSIRFPNLQRELAVTILFVPSTVLWVSSGIIKEPLVFLGVSLFIVQFFTLFEKQKASVKDKMKVLFGFIFVMLVKFYVAIALLFASAAFCILRFKELKPRKNSLTIVLFIGFMALIVGAGAYSMHKFYVWLGRETQISLIKDIEKSKKYNIQKSKGSGGSTYSVVNWDGTVVGFFFSVASSINVTLFRPYIWESKKITIVPAFVESLITLLFTVFVLFKITSRRFFSTLFSDSHIVFLLVFSIIVAIIIGYTSLNFGTLSRYKSTILPFYLTALVILYNKFNRIKLDT